LAKPSIKPWEANAAFCAPDISMPMDETALAAVDFGGRS
jgi:hypothetical protein